MSEEKKRMKQGAFLLDRVLPPARPSSSCTSLDSVDEGGGGRRRDRARACARESGRREPTSGSKKCVCEYVYVCVHVIIQCAVILVNSTSKCL